MNMQEQEIERESMEFDVVIVGAGPAGLSAAIKIRQLAIENNLNDLSVCVVEKGSEVGAHILSGAVLEPRAMNELFPNWKEEGAPLNVPVTEDKTYFLLSDEKSQEAPHWMVPKTMHNDGNYVISLGNVVRWLGQKAEELEVSIFPGFAAAEILYHADGSVKGIQTGDMGIGKDGEPTHNFTPGYELHAKYTLFAEGCRGHLGKRLIAKYNLDKDSDPQHYGIGIKELWEIDPAKHKPGLVMHGAGWPLSETGSSGGWWLYHAENNQVTLGMIIDLSYTNPHMYPFMESEILNLDIQSNGVAIVELHRPDTRNALNLELRQQLAAMFEQLAASDTVRAIVITGGEKVFAAGADIRDFTTAKTVDMYLRHTEQYWRAIIDCPKPIVAAVNGYALGGGCELAMHADIIIAGKSAQFGQPEVKLGLMPGAGGTQRLLRAVGKFKAMQIVLTGKIFSAEEADKMGLVSEVVEDDQTLAKAVEIATQIAQLSPIAVEQIKEVTTLGANMPLDGALALERKAFQILFDTQDQKEGVNAFFEKRSPQYQGK